MSSDKDAAVILTDRETLLSPRVTLILNLFFIGWFYEPQAAITPCTIGILAFVALNTMSSYVYRNMRLGYYKDYSITSSVIDRALQRPDQTSQPQREIVFENVISTKPLGTRDLEAELVEVTGPRNV